MIERNTLVRMGTFVKPHGVNGEMALTVPEDMDWSEDTSYLVCMMNGIPVPFFVESIREKSRTVILVKFDDIDDIRKTDRFMGVTVYLPKEFHVETEDDVLSWSSFIDYSVIDTNAGYLGKIEAVDDSTMNVLFLVRDGDRERVIPANEAWIIQVDSDKCQIIYELPEGLADL